jgi:hypothetical protein
MRLRACAERAGPAKEITASRTKATRKQVRRDATFEDAHGDEKKKQGEPLTFDRIVWLSTFFRVYRQILAILHSS